VLCFLLPSHALPVLLLPLGLPSLADWPIHFTAIRKIKLLPTQQSAGNCSEYDDSFGVVELGDDEVAVMWMTTADCSLSLNSCNKLLLTTYSLPLSPNIPLDSIKLT
jgi:hypothetical protein